MKTGEKGLELIRHYEGCMLIAYVCPAGKWTIGYGHTGAEVKKGMNIDIFQANIYLRQDVGGAESIVKNAVHVPLNQNQFDALVSFVFNVGPGRKGLKDGFVTLKNGNPSTLLRLINDGDFAGALAEFPKWNKANGRPSQGLTNRREAEQELFATPI